MTAVFGAEWKPSNLFKATNFKFGNKIIFDNQAILILH